MGDCCSLLNLALNDCTHSSLTFTSCEGGFHVSKSSSCGERSLEVNRGACVELKVLCGRWRAPRSRRLSPIFSRSAMPGLRTLDPDIESNVPCSYLVPVRAPTGLLSNTPSVRRPSQDHGFASVFAVQFADDVARSNRRSQFINISCPDRELITSKFEIIILNVYHQLPSVISLKYKCAIASTVIIPGGSVKVLTIQINVEFIYINFRLTDNSYVNHDSRCQTYIYIRLSQAPSPYAFTHPA